MNEVYQQVLVYAASLWRKRWYIALIGWGLSLLGWIGVMALPDRYESQSRVYIDTDNLLAPLLRGISVESNVGQQVDFMQRTLLSRPNIDEADGEQVLALVLDDLHALGDILEQEVLVGLRRCSQVDKDLLFKDIAKRVQIVQNQGKNLFTVSFVDSSP